MIEHVQARTPSSPEMITEIIGGVTVLHVAGEIDAATSRLWRDRCVDVLRGEPAALVIDLSGVRFFASSGIGVLVEIQDVAAGHGVPMALVAPQREVTRPMQATGLASIYPLHSDLVAALRAVDQPAV
ncbi:STAS domain-containing protein [Umezawaea beigongshangensis]|uniref:STAS domain-containing protein n=1 Tax=Umezawaea beigongshangensis TaxID=2780383 RepID=UPI0018F269E5|nr:STAS domain-containing protein [Umezawaea beigongshangensis]